MRQQPKKQAWGHASVVRNDSGLIPVFRGQHGGADWLQSQLGSLSFSTPLVASCYALRANKGGIAEIPVIFPVYLNIERPFINDPFEAFLDLSFYESAMSFEHMVRIACKFATLIERTDSWCEQDKQIYGSVSAQALSNPKSLRHCYAQLYPILDDPEEVALLRAFGFDGAIYQGSGMSAGLAEFRIFCPTQAKSIWSSF